MKNQSQGAIPEESNLTPGQNAGGQAPPPMANTQNMPALDPNIEQAMSPKPKKKRGKKIILIVILVILFLMISGAATTYFALKNSGVGEMFGFMKNVAEDELAKQEEEENNSANNNIIDQPNPDSNLPTDNNNKKNIADEKCATEQIIKDVENFMSAVTRYYSVNGKYPEEKTRVYSRDTQNNVLCDDGFHLIPEHCANELYWENQCGSYETVYQYMGNSELEKPIFFVAFEIDESYGELEPGIVVKSNIEQEMENISKEDLMEAFAYVSTGEDPDKEEEEEEVDVNKWTLSNIKQIQTALELYNVDENIYPTTEGEIILGTDKYIVLCENVGFTNKNDRNCETIYMGSVYSDPAGDGYRYYGYERGEYYIIFELTEKTNALGEGVNIATPDGIKTVDEMTYELDTDEDGINDWMEINIWKTNFEMIDTDSDGYTDKQEIDAGYDPLVAGSAKLTDR